jgi:hypothetical protein
MATVVQHHVLRWNLADVLEEHFVHSTLKTEAVFSLKRWSLSKPYGGTTQNTTLVSSS